MDENRGENRDADRDADNFENRDADRDEKWPKTLKTVMKSGRKVATVRGWSASKFLTECRLTECRSCASSGLLQVVDLKHIRFSQEVPIDI